MGIQKVHARVLACAQAREEGVYRHDHREELRGGLVPLLPPRAEHRLRHIQGQALPPNLPFGHVPSPNLIMEPRNL